MKLSEAVRGVSGTLAADGEFSCIAFATEQEQSQFLTFLEKEKFLPALDLRIGGKDPAPYQRCVPL